MYIVLLARYRSLNLFVLLPKLYVIFALGVILPATTKPARVPVLVIFGCAFVVTVAALVAVVALVALPALVAKLALVAVVADVAVLAVVADDADPARAERIVSLWAERFNQQVQKGAGNAFALQAIKVSLENGEVSLADVEEEIARLEANSLGITSYVEVSFSQKESLPIARKNSLGEYIFFGTVTMLFAATLGILFSGKKDG